MELHIFLWNYEITVVQESYISKLELQKWFREFVFSFLKHTFVIWDSGLVFLWDLKQLIPIRKKSIPLDFDSS